MDNQINNRGQVTMFIIVGILIFVAILLVFYFTGRISFTEDHIQNPEAYLENCMVSSAKEAENIIFSSNGYPKLESNYILYNKEKVPYLCTVSEFYNTCIPQEPAFFNYINNLMENKVAVDTETCLDSLVKEFEKRGYSIEVNPGNITLKIQKESIYVNFGKVMYLTKQEDTKQIGNIHSNYGTNLYNLLKLEQMIVNYESTLCEFNKMDWMKEDKDIIVSTIRTSDQTKIYTLQDRMTGKEIKFAIKTCVLPAGI